MCDIVVVFFKQKTAYEMRMRDWSSDVCSSDLLGDQLPAGTIRVYMRDARGDPQFIGENRIDHTPMGSAMSLRTGDAFDVKVQRSEEHTSELQSLMRSSYAVFCLKKKKHTSEPYKIHITWKITYNI